ncbi:ComEC/Rec2 family competence protein [Leucobacter weissii]|uniref:ComEC/Rec2 family competence protein n=2 Tax=Leucobacter weissii TaxID=1983706 RepID=A0A939MQK5_9MICO|nr:ComEC/Rec2 family competence protein [Leucobacter weissii]MBO1902887.1 ComEC/Rec2 family competence protein [Leucobacter weissii]
MARGSPELLEPASSAGFGVDVHEIRERESGGPSALLGGLAAELRTGLRNAAERMPGTELVPGFAVGDTSLVSEDLDEAMLASSLTHLTAVSGANCALVVGAISWVLAGLGAGRRLRPLLAAAALGLFVTVVGPDASVQRAAVMAAVILVSGFGGKRANALPALGLAMLVLLLADPWQALQPGFALSVVATAGILLMAAPIADRLRSLVRLPAAFALPVSVALAAQLACGPLLLLLQPGIPAVGVVANAIAAPAAPLGTGLGLVSALLLQTAPALGDVALFCAGLPARWVAATARVSAELPAGRWHWPGGWNGALLLVACQTALLLAWALRHGHIGLPGGARATRRRPWRAAPHVPLRVRLASTALSGLGLGTIAAITLLAPSAARLSVPHDWAVVACDVGQGDGLLLRDPDLPDEVMLVDTGDDPALIGACLERFGVDRIALAVLSHDDGDHVGALPALLDRIDAALIAPAVRGEETARREVVRRLEAAQIPYRIGRRGLRSSGAAGPAWEVLAPAAGRAPPDTNSASLVMRVAVGRARVLLLGDTGAEEQRELLRSGTELAAEVIKVAHHGSRDQDPGLPAAVGAEWALVSVGTGNGYGHPVPETLAALVDVGARPLRTDLHGSIALVALAGGGLEPWVERAEGDASEARP